jgi:hypothetical protein
VRTDSGPGACEVVYIEDFDILGSANRGWRLAFKISLFALLASVLLWAFMPVTFRD